MYTAYYSRSGPFLLLRQGQRLHSNLGNNQNLWWETTSSRLEFEGCRRQERDSLPRCRLRLRSPLCHQRGSRTSPLLNPSPVLRPAFFRWCPNFFCLALNFQPGAAAAGGGAGARQEAGGANPYNSGPIQTVGSAYSDLPTAQKRIMQYMANNDGGDGFNVYEVQRAIAAGVPQDKFRQEIEQLISDGHLYSTEDDDQLVFFLACVSLSLFSEPVLTLPSLFLLLFSVLPTASD